MAHRPCLLILACNNSFEWTRVRARRVTQALGISLISIHRLSVNSWSLQVNRPVKIILAIVIIIAVPKVIQSIFLGNRSSSPAKVITQLANEMSAGLPKKIDAVTTLTKVELDGNTYRIYYTMDSGVTIDPAQRDAYLAMAKKQICGSGMRAILDNRITIEYLYTYVRPGAGEQKLAITIPPGSCA
jgi:hypothetical protein